MQEKNNMQGNKFYMVFVPFIITFVVQNAIAIFVMQLSLVGAFASYKSGSYVEFVEKWANTLTETWFSESVLVSYGIVCTIIFYQMYKRLREREKPGSFKISLTGATSNGGLMLLGLVIVAISAQYVCGFVMDAFGTAFPAWMQEYLTLLDNAGFGEDMPVLMILYAVFLGPICEELAFRGLTFKYARGRMSPAAAIILQAALFAAFHMNKLQATFTFIVGLVLGYIMFKYDNLIVVIILHILFNGPAAIISGLLSADSSNPITYFCWLLASLVVLYIGILILKKAAPEVKEQEQSSDN